MHIYSVADPEFKPYGKVLEGYDTTEHYIRQFKKHTKMTPSAYRKESASSRNR